MGSRGKNPSQKTIMQLCARSAGRCQFEGCNKNLFIEGLTLKRGYFGNIAHNVASSPEGPRGDKATSSMLSDDVDNLLLLCHEHHKLVDDNPEEFTEARLREMKQKHEKMIASHCDLIWKESSEVLRFLSPIKGTHSVSINLQQAIEAIIPSFRPASERGLIISIQPLCEYNTPEYWQQADNDLTSKVKLVVGSIQNDNPNQHFSIFPIGPIPLIAKLGYLLGDKIRCEVYQKSRVPDTWKWISEEQTNHLFVQKNTIREGNRVALILSLTDLINESRVTGVFNADTIYKISAEHTGVSCLKSETDLAEFWNTYQAVCNEITNTYPDVNEIAVFPAVPVSAAFSIGYRYMPGVYPKMTIYEENNGFVKTISFGGNGL